MTTAAPVIHDKIAREHSTRLRSAILSRHGAASVGPFLIENTTLAFSPFSFKDHEYQERILGDVSTEINVQKCSQVGLSEASARKALALVNILEPYTLAYTLPTAKFAGTFAKTRVDPVIATSKYLREAIHSTVDNNETKQFGLSFLHFKGAASGNAAISIPCDHLIHDEVDFSDQEILGQYYSRLNHSKWKRIDRFSTPTLPDYGINRHFKESKRWYNTCKCNHCNHRFIPDYYKHVKVPRYDEDLRNLTKYTLSRIDYKMAVLLCPRCGKAPSLQVEYREWVCENPGDNYDAVGYQVTPFDAPNVVTSAMLVKASVSYARHQDFVNFSLGLPADDLEATLVPSDFDRMWIDAARPDGVVYVMGVDVGSTYHFVIAAVDGYGDMVVAHAERVVMGHARERYMALRAQYRVICTVIDSAPHAETVMALQNLDYSLYASVYTRSKSLLTHKVLDQEEDSEEGRDFVRQVNINRSRALDSYMEYLRSGHMKLCQMENDTKQAYVEQHCSMKRVRQYDNESGELVYAWQKTDGVDHFHHAGLYCYIASKIRGVGRSNVLIPIAGSWAFKLSGSQ